MKQNLFRNLALVLTLLVGSASADDSVWNYNCGPHLASAQPLKCGFSFSGDWLYWNVHQKHLDYAIKIEEDITLGGEMKHISYDWRSGFRIGLGCNFPCGGWAYKIDWTHIKAEGTSSVEEEGEFPIRAHLVHPSFFAENAEKARGERETKYNVIDILLENKLFASKAYMIRPYFGVRALLLDQEQDVTYEGNEFGEGDDAAQVNFESELWAVGLHGGVEGSYQLRCGMSLFGDFGASILAGKTENEYLQTDPENIFFEETIVNVFEEEYLTIPGCHLGAGLVFEDRLGCDCYLTLKLGYEIHHWFQVPEMRRFLNGSQEGATVTDSSSSLGLHGLVFRIKLDF